MTWVCKKDSKIGYSAFADDCKCYQYRLNFSSAILTVQSESVLTVVIIRTEIRIAI